MDLISLSQQADLEWEVAIAALDGALRTSGMTCRELAERVGISPQHLSYVRHGARMLSMEVARRVTAALPLTREQRSDLLGHVEQCRALQRQARCELGRVADDVAQMVKQMQEAHALASFSPDPDQASRQYRIALNLGELLLEHPAVRRQPLDLLEVCAVLHDAYSVLNRPSRALMCAKWARFVAEYLEPRQFRAAGERIEFFQVNALRMEAVALHNLNLDDQALALSERVECHPLVRRDPKFWLPHIYRDQLNTLAGLGRFSIRRAQAIARHAQRLCESSAHPDGELSSFLISRSLANAYSKHGNVKQAMNLVECMTEHIHHLTRFGPLHRVMFLRTAAQVYAAAGDASGAAFWRHQAIALARQSGLRHQLAQLGADEAARA